MPTPNRTADLPPQFGELTRRESVAPSRASLLRSMQTRGRRLVAEDAELLHDLMTCQLCGEPADDASPVCRACRYHGLALASLLGTGRTYAIRRGLHVVGEEDGDD